MKVTLDDIAKVVNGKYSGNGSTIIRKPAKIEEAEEGDITFLANPKYEPFIYTTGASVVLVDAKYEPSKDIDPILLKVEDVYSSLSTLLETFQDSIQQRNKGISATAIIAEDAKISDDVFVGEHAVIGAETKVAEGSQIHAGVFLGKGVCIGMHCVIHAGVRVMSGTIIGDNCVLHPNSVIGSDGFGFVPDKEGKYSKVPQTGIVRIGNDVEIGANVTIDRATMGETKIGNGVKIDNLVQIAHNVEVGEHTVIAAQAGIAGSTKIGKHCIIGGQVGISGHLQIADGTQIQAQSGVSKSTTSNARLFGSPAMDYTSFQRSYIHFKNFVDIEKRIRALEAKSKEEK